MKNRCNKPKKLLAFITILSVLIGLLPLAVAADTAVTVRTRGIPDSDIKSTTAYVSCEVRIANSNKLVSKGIAYSEEENDHSPQKKEVNKQVEEYADTLTGLKPATRYYVRAYADYYNDNAVIVTKYGEEISIRTKRSEIVKDSIVEPTFETTGSPNATFKSAYTTLGHTVLASGFVYSNTTNTPTLNSGGVSAVGEPTSETSGTIIEGITGLNTKTPYYARAFVLVEDPEGAKLQGVALYSNAVVVLASEISKPEVSTVTARLESDRIYAEGKITSGSAVVTERGFVYSTTDKNPVLFSNPNVKSSDTSGSNFSASFYVSTNSEDTYYVRAYAKINDVVGYGDYVTVHLNSEKPTVYTNSISRVEDNSADIYINVSNTGGSSIKRRGAVYSYDDSSPELNESDTYYETVSGTTGYATVRLTGLRSGTKYYVRAFAENSSGIGYGSTDSFITTGTYDGWDSHYDSRIQTVEVRNISEQSATAYGYTGSSSYTITERGFVYSSTHSTPTINDSRVSDSSGGTGDYAVTLTNLTRNTKYYIRAYIRTSQGTSYGGTLNFTTYSSSSAVPTYPSYPSSGTVPSSNEKAFMAGVGNYRFSPDVPITRAEVAQMIYDLSNGQHYGTGKSFTDVSGNQQAKAAIDYVSSQNFMRGYPDGSFRPQATITRAELAVVLSAAYSLSGTATSNFADVKANSWSYPYISLATKAGMLTGYPDGTYRPGNTATRAEACKVFSSAAGRSLVPIGSEAFADVPANHWAYRYIMNAAVSRP